LSERAKQMSLTPLIVGSRVLAVDYHAFKLNGVVAPRLHYHRGLEPKSQQLHRPYQGGW
jgi:hypothetical protein